MSLHARKVNFVDHAIRHTLLRRIERPGAGPRSDARRRLLHRAAARAGSPFWPALFRDVYPARAAVGIAGVEIAFGWRELALVHAFRPSGVFGPFSSQMR
jgi:hypothetical protein